MSNDSKSSNSSIFGILSICMIVLRLILHSSNSSNMDPETSARFSKIMEQSSKMMEENALTLSLVNPERVKEFPNELNKLTENSYILFAKCGNFTERSLCKVDRIKKNQIVLTKVDHVFHQNKDWKAMDEIFNVMVRNAIDVKTDLKNIKKSIGTVYKESERGYSDGFDIFDNGSKYYIHEIYLYKKESSSTNN